MGGVDRGDQGKQRFSVSSSVITKKWWFRIFSGLLDMALHNAWVLYDYEVRGSDRLKHQDFLLAVATELVEKANLFTAPSGNTRAAELANHKSWRQVGKTQCVQCAKNKKRKRTTHMCLACCYAMCDGPCFSLFHAGDRKVSKRFRKVAAKQMWIALIIMYVVPWIFNKVLYNIYQWIQNWALIDLIYKFVAYH